MRVSHVLTGQPAPPHTGDVRVYMQGQEAPAGYTEIAIVQGHGAGRYAAMPDVVGALQADAASLGCNAVLNVRIDQGSSNATANGVCVRYASPSPANPDPR